MNRTDLLILQALAAGPRTVDDLAAEAGVARQTAARRARLLWLRLAANREPVLTGRGGRPRIRYLAGLASAQDLKETGR